MVQPGHKDSQPAVQPAATPQPAASPMRRAERKAVTAARDRFEGSLAQSFVMRLKAIDFSDQVMLFGAGMLVSALPFLILLSAFASNRVDDDISLRLGLPSAISTGVFFAGLGVFSKFYFSSTIISDSKTYGTIGAVFSIMTWFVAIGAVIILGAVAGATWEDRKAKVA
jgi:uncharacterized BrkB/YihY/UPF0761 family membrane protein